MSLKNCRQIELPKIVDYRGNLSFIESGEHIPFAIKRVYYLYDVPAGADRGGHAHKDLQQLLIPLAGSFDIQLDDGSEKKTFHLNRPFQGLYISSRVWREINNFSSGSVCLVLASEHYDEEDYYRNYHDFIAALKTSA